ncbi:hypothetical protein BME99_24025 [Pseudomonas protegens]|nr:hypothetical protein BME99_24025 [Pseudomonas protegens]
MADRLLQLARHYPELPEPARSRWDDGLLGLDIGDELMHLRLSLAVAQVPVGAAQRAYFEHLQRTLEQGPAGSRQDALEQPSVALLEALGQQPPSDALKLAQARRAIAKQLAQLVPAAGGKSWGCVSGRWAGCCSARS